MNDIETNKDLLNSLLEKATPPKKEKFTVIKSFKGYTMSALAAAAVVMIIAFGIKDYKEPIDNRGREISTPHIASEETLDIKSEEMAAYDGAKMARNVPAGIVRELTKEEYYSYIGINIEKLKIPDDLKNQGDNKINILEDENGEVVTDYHTFSFSGKDERYISISTAKTKEADTDWVKTVSDKNYTAVYSIKNGVQINVECYMLTKKEQKALIDSFNN